MDIEGCVQVAVEWDGSRIRGLRVGSTRMDLAHGLLCGRRAEEARSLLPRLFSICARAQAAAASVALDAARGAGREDVRRDEMAVLAEASLEYLWRFQIDLPGLLGFPQRHEALARLRRELARLLTAEEERGHADETQAWRTFIGELNTAVHEECFGGSGEAAFADLESLRAWEARSDSQAARLMRAVRATALGGNGIALLPSASEALLLEIGEALERDPGFSRRPQRAGAPAECGALARLDGHPLLRAAKLERTNRAYLRILARMLELIDIPERLAGLLGSEKSIDWVRGVRLGPGRGIAGVETARGLLVHAATLEGERIASYRIVAPTEWNFHPRGALCSDLLQVRVHSRAQVEQHAALALYSLDPCVRHTLEIART